MALNVRATLTLVRRYDGAVLRTDLESRGHSSDGVSFEQTVSPANAGRSVARRLALADQEKNKNVPNAVGNTTTELNCWAVFTVDGHPERHSVNFEENAEAWRPGDVALSFQNSSYDEFADRDDKVYDFTDLDDGEVGWVSGGSNNIALSTHILGGLEWRGG